MEYLQTTLSREEWLARIFRKSKAERSFRSARAALKAFDNFCLGKFGKDAQSIITDLKGNPGDQLYIFLNNFAGFMDDKSPKTIRTYFGWIRSYLRSQGIKTDLDDLKDFVSFPTQIVERRKALTKETIRKLLDNSKEQRKALYLTLLSSGMRVGEALALRKRDFDFTKDPIVISIPARYTKNKQGRETFISSEAKELLLRLVKRKNDDDLVFTHQLNNEQAVHNEEMAFRKLRKRCDLQEKYADGKRFVVNMHAFRAYFHTKASKIQGEEYANALDGHSSYLGQYYRNTDEERAEMYRELEPNLLIYSSIEMAQTQKEMNKRIDEVKKKSDDEFEKLKEEFRNDHIIVGQLTKTIESFLKRAFRGDEEKMNSFLEGLMNPSKTILVDHLGKEEDFNEFR